MVQWYNGTWSGQTVFTSFHIVESDSVKCLVTTGDGVVPSKTQPVQRYEVFLLRMIVSK
jgi:hypothetical protein